MANPNGKDKPKKKWKGGYSNFGFRGQKEPCIVEPTQPRVNVRPDIPFGRQCPYKAWRFYFPTEEYLPESETKKTVQILESYMVEHFKSCDQDTILNSQSISIDYKEIISHDVIKSKMPHFAEKLLTTPDHILNCVGLAAHQTAVNVYRQMAGTSNEALDDIPVIQSRIHNLERLMTLKQLKAKSYGQFVAIKGTVVKVSNVKPLCTTIAFRCNVCKRMQALLLLEYKYITPHSCDDPRCYSKSFSPIRNHPLTEITNRQTIILQETLSDLHRESGRMPRTIEIEILRDLTDTASPGDVVTVTGIMRVKKTEEGGRFSKNVKDKCMYMMYLEGNHISNTRRKNMQDRRGASADTTLEFTELDMDGISKIQTEDDIFSLMVSSVCPTIYGLEMVKAGIVLALFGGDQLGSKPSDDRIPFRGDSHVLVVGDPGMGKSQMLRAASRLAPRGVYVCGNTSTSSGLTVTLSRDSNGDTSLEAGALVLADQGVCCIDEFDKMGGQQQVLLEAMEQQCISIAKAGVVCSLPARCSIIAAANPVGGHYTKAKTVSENLRMGSALLSRFDLVFILVDTPDEEKDRMLSEHVMAIHSTKSSGVDRKKIFKGLNSSHPFTSSLESRLSAYSRSDDVDPVPHSVAWKYIAYARKNITDITLSVEACQVLKEFYLKLRRQGLQGDGTPITTRQLESLKRLSQARAKLEMRNMVTEQDAKDVIEIMKYSLHDTFSDENDSLVFSRSMHGSGVSGRGAAKKLINILHQVAKRKSNNILSSEEMKSAAVGLNLPSHKLLEIIDSLNNQGFLLQKGSGTYKLQTL